MDVTQAKDWQDKAVARIVNKYGRLDVLVSNAGGALQNEDIEHMKTSNVDKIIAHNLNSVIYGCKAFSSLMKLQNSETIINLSSVCSKHAWPGWSVYAVAKWGVVGFSKNIYVDLRPFGIRITCVIPGAGATDFMKHAVARIWI